MGLSPVSVIVLVPHRDIRTLGLGDWLRFGWEIGQRDKKETVVIAACLHAKILFCVPGDNVPFVQEENQSDAVPSWDRMKDLLKRSASFLECTVFLTQLRYGLSYLG